MKKILLLLFMFFSFSAAMAQGNNLQFSNVLTMSFEAAGSTDDTQTLTVPSGQVLKITSAHASNATNRNYNDLQILKFKELSSSSYTNLTSGTENSYSNSSNNFPIWLKAGIYMFKLDNEQNSGTGTAILTGIYFNIFQ